jgi:hypothetical protein
MSVKRWNGTGWDTYAGAGVQGTQGTQGAQGTQGTQGLQGTTGPQGTAGSNGSNGAQGTTGASGQFPATAVSSNISLAAFNAYMVDTTSARTLTLPASPTIGNEIHIFDATGSAATNNITVANNSTNINGQNTNLTIDKAYAGVTLIYVGSAYGWRVS